MRISWRDVRECLLGATLYTAAIALAVLAAWLVSGCGRPQPLPTIPVAITAWPSPIRPSCNLPTLPPQPKLSPYETADSTAVRIYVRIADIIELNAWLSDVSTVIDIQRQCLQKLTGNP